MNTTSTAAAFLLARITAFVTARSTEFLCRDCARSTGGHRSAPPADQLAWCVSCGRSSRVIEEAALAEKVSRPRRRRAEPVATRLAS